MSEQVLRAALDMANARAERWKVRTMKARADLEAAEARVAAVRALADEWDAGRRTNLGSGPCRESVDMVMRLAIDELRAALTTPTTDQPASAGGA